MNQSLEEMLEETLRLCQQGKLNDLPGYLMNSLADALDRAISLATEKEVDSNDV